MHGFTEHGVAQFQTFGMKKIITIILVITGLCSQSVKASDEIGGIGILIGKREGRIEVVLVGKGTPADEAGLHIEDRILKIGEKPTKDMSLESTSAELKGAINTTVIIQLISLGTDTPREVKLIRKKIDKEKIIWKKECVITLKKPTGQTTYVESQEQVEKETQKK